MGVVNQIKLTEDELKIVRDILKQYIPNMKVYAFGSRVAGAVKKFSDLDLAIISEEPIDHYLLFELKDAFEESDLVIKVDVSQWLRLPTWLKKDILENYFIIQ